MANETRAKCLSIHSLGISGLAGAFGQEGKHEPTLRICHRFETFRSTQPSKLQSSHAGDVASSSSSSSSSIFQGKYDVFLSFRGEDTRNNFTSHLYTSLRRKQIQTFIDNNLRRGEEISPSLLRAIEESKLAIVIFSTNYASSRWCLDELVKILQCKRMNGQVVIPVFYLVDPSDVRHQSGSFGEALARHEATENVDKVERWRVALQEAANLSGWDSQVIRPEAELVEKVVEDVWKKLNRMSEFRSLGGLIGIDSHVQNIELLLCLESTKVRSVGIWGMGGIGKTTIAEVVFSRIYSQFDGFHFLSNVREELKRHGAVAVWKRFLMDMLDERSSNMGALSSLRLDFMEQRLRYGKFLVVFDDVDDSMSIQFQELLARHHEIFGEGSKIIITSRDRHVLKNLSVDDVYKVWELSFDEAFQVFCFSAFKKTYPSVEVIKQSLKMVKYAKGNPLALKLLGSAMFDRGEEEWNSVTSELEKVSKPRIMDVLKVSYAGLSDAEQSIFLDIACFFKGENRDYATKVLEGCYSCVSFILSNLIDKSLVTISRQNNSIMMHDLLQEMGWEIVRKECISNPGKRSRIWDPEDVYYVLTRKKGTEAIESIILDISKAKEMHIESDAFASMERLRFLKFWKSHSNPVSSTGNVQLPHDGLHFLSTELRCLYWEGFPSKSLPSSFCAENLVNLDLPESEAQTHWTGAQVVILTGGDLSFRSLCDYSLIDTGFFIFLQQRLVSLRRINLMFSKYLTEIPDLSNAQMIEEIILRGCENLTSIPERIESKSLKVLDLSSCKSIKKCPEILGVLEELYLEGTGIEELPQSLHKLKFLRLFLAKGLNITKFPEVSNSIEDLRLSGTGIVEIPSSIEFLTRLVELGLADNKKLSSLPDSIGKLKSLKFLTLSDCPNLKRLPDSILKLKSLTSLSLDGTAIKDLPRNIHKLGKLDELDTSKIKGVNLLPLVGLRSLTSLYLRGCYPFEIPNALWSLSSLTRLNLSDNDFEILSADIKCLSQLRYLYLKNCRRVRKLPEMPNSLYHLTASNCESLETISSVDSSTLNMLNLANCFKLEQETCHRIMEDAALTVAIGRKKFSYMRTDVQILLPRSEIPLWFGDQYIGSSATVRLLESCHHLKGMAFCIVFSLGEAPSSHLDGVRCVCLAKDTNGEEYISAWYADLYDSPRSDHVLLWYACSTSREKISFSKISAASFEFYLEWNDKLNHKLINDCQIKQCGVHLFFHDHPDESCVEDGYGYEYYTDEEASGNSDEGSDDQDQTDSEEENPCDVPESSCE
ncbi:hypothetical protein Tsubulata_000691 [Turnera subulata]|uniref:ADP-ribosyl cyclase/cyclic ADP-ribose hydrolase n=1 Tax=Turnera subulata TaxID=218843 RepID=A0A9Q0J7P9_9ROSI|nr:hypothetical protein Tsubulata_000691 [Turnera subulata]